jgi:LmbE family N-acetylglucosaminyl deacetylase
MDKQLRIIVFGAHPDDCDIKVGGTAALWAQAGHHVQFVSVTNGDAGHQTLAGTALARRRWEESQAAAQVLGIEYLILDNHDGELMPTLENRRAIIKLIREQRPHLVLGPRPFDYHPDHRYTATLVQDAAYMVTVPNIVAYAEHLSHNPVIMYVSDHFQKPYPFTADVAVDIDAVFEQKIQAMGCHVSQFFEWLPYNAGILAEVPAEETARLRWFHDRMAQRMSVETERCHAKLIERYGEERTSSIRFTEAFEICEYGSQPTPDDLQKLFPF